MDGRELGCPLGKELGCSDAIGVGFALGLMDGRELGSTLGLMDGRELGCPLGKELGGADVIGVGFALGFAVGSELGSTLGLMDGRELGFGLAFWTPVGLFVGLSVDFDAVGLFVNDGLGAGVFLLVGIEVDVVVGIWVLRLGALVTVMLGTVDMEGDIDGESVTFATQISHDFWQ